MLVCVYTRRGDMTTYNVGRVGGENLFAVSACAFALANASA